MGLLDELKKLTKPYDDEDYLEEDLTDPVRVPGQDNRSYASYAEAPRNPEPAQPAARRHYVFSRPQSQKSAYNPYEQQNYTPPQGYGQQQPQYAQQPRQQQAYYNQQPQYAQQPRNYAVGRGAYAASAAAPAQPKLLLVRPDRFEVAADIADRISDRNAIVLNLEETNKDVARRMLDFLSGVTYALGGNIKKVSGSTYVITPAGMDFMGDGLEEMDTRKYF